MLFDKGPAVDCQYGAGIDLLKFPGCLLVEIRLIVCRHDYGFRRDQIIAVCSWKGSAVVIFHLARQRKFDKNIRLSGGSKKCRQLFTHGYEAVVLLSRHGAGAAIDNGVG